MARRILERYNRTDSDQLIVDINAGRVADLYNNFDKYTPYVKKELDWDLVEYLIDSVKEIGSIEFVIQFHFTEAASEELLQRIQQSIYNYFLYLKERELRDLARKIRTSIIFLFVGILFLVLSFWFNQKMLETDDVYTNVLAQGLIVAAWVSLWEALANFLINWTPHRRMIKIYDRIANAPILYKSDTSAA